MKKRYKIINKIKFVSFLVIMLTVLTTSIIILFLKDNKAYSSTYEENYISINIKEGDTLWNIAINHMPKGYDVRKMVFEIIEFNNIENASIYPGDSIKLPIKHNPK